MKLTTFDYTLGPSVGGKKRLLSLNDSEKKELLVNIQKKWRKLLDLHFKNEAGISDGSSLYKWKELTEKHATYKDANGFRSGILEMSTPTLLTRYKRQVKYNVKNFNININYPMLKSGAKNNPADAGVHQLGRVKRRIILKDFKNIAKQEVRDYLVEKFA